MADSDIETETETHILAEVDGDEPVTGVYVVRFQTTAEVSYLVRGTENQAFEFTPPEWPDEDSGRRYRISYSQWEPCGGETAVEEYPVELIDGQTLYDLTEAN